MLVPNIIKFAMISFFSTLINTVISMSTVWQLAKAHPLTLIFWYNIVSWKIFLYSRKSQSDWLHYFSKIQDGYTCTYKIRCKLKQFIMKKKDSTITHKNWSLQHKGQVPVVRNKESSLDMCIIAPHKHTRSLAI